MSGSVPRFWRVMNVFANLVRGDANLSVIPESGILHVLIDSAASRYGKDWETVASEYRERYQVTVGSGYKKETEE